MIQIDARNITWDLGRDITYEVLIENLGGYESAKYKLRDNGSLHSERLKKALLEYRRQHNIFEVGDDIVSTTGSIRTVFKITDITDEFIQADHFELRHGACRHATDAEIEAGKRLEVV
jgi:hypothetical protein